MYSTYIVAWEEGGTRTINSVSTARWTPMEDGNCGEDQG